VTVFNQQIEDAARAEARVAHNEAAGRVVDVGVVAVAGGDDAELAAVDFEAVRGIDADFLASRVELQRDVIADNVGRAWIGGSTDDVAGGGGERHIGCARVDVFGGDGSASVDRDVAVGRSDIGQSHIVGVGKADGGSGAGGSGRDTIHAGAERNS